MPTTYSNTVGRALIYETFGLAPSFPRRQESSNKTFREADKAVMLSRFAGYILINDSRLRRNDGFFEAPLY